MIIYYNPDCSKCQQALDLLHEANCNIEIRNYLVDPPSVDELKKLTALLNCSPLDILRKNELFYVEQYGNKSMTDDDIYVLLSQHPALIERPIVIDGTRAVIGRPPALVKTLFK